MAKRFNQFQIQAPSQGFTGDKIKISKVINREILVHDYKVEPSKYQGSCLWLQVEFGGTKYVIFTGSAPLIKMIEQVPKGEFPFLTTIVQEDLQYEFT